MVLLAMACNAADDPAAGLEAMCLPGISILAAVTDWTASRYFRHISGYQNIFDGETNQEQRKSFIQSLNVVGESDQH